MTRGQPFFRPVSMATVSEQRLPFQLRFLSRDLVARNTRVQSVSWFIFDWKAVDLEKRYLSECVND